MYYPKKRFILYYQIVLGNKSSIGQATKKILQNFRNYRTAILNPRTIAKACSINDNKVILSKYATTCGKTLSPSEKYDTSQNGHKIFQEYVFFNTKDIKNFNKVIF